MADEKKITKIVINSGDELTDVVTAILNSRNERVVLTFAEETDLLISPINLKVLLETADEKEKLLVAQIIKNPTGLRNANLAGLSTIDSPQFPDENVWETEEINRAKRLAPPKKREPTKSKKTKAEEIETKDEPTDFQKRIDAAIAKSKESSQRKELSDDDFLITLDEDLPSADTSEPEITLLKEDPIRENANASVKKQQSTEEGDKQNLSKIDFSKKTKDPIKDQAKEKKSKGKNFKQALNAITSGISAFFKKIPVPKKLKKLAPIIAISLLLLTLLVGFIYLNTALLVRVKIYVEAKEVTIEETFQGDENIKEVNFEENKIPIKTESVEKARSSNIKATGTAFRGEKATGSANLTYLKEECTEETNPLEIPSGTALSTKGLTYTLDSPVTLQCNIPTTEPIPFTAIEVGEEYNLPSGQIFTLQGYSSSTLVVTNSTAITGGSKEEYTVLSKADVDNAVKDLSKIAIEEGENELKDINGKWQIISDSITSEVLADSTKTDLAIGAEATNVNVSITTESLASYYLNDGFEHGVETLLTEKAKEENLFETEKDWDLELDEEIEKEISVVESNAQGTAIKLIASSTVKPRVDTEDILSKLKTMKWEEGKEYLQSLEFSEKETRVEFFPEWFPDGLKRFPKRQGGVLISVKNVN